jgi:hypothetical protein
VVTEIWPGWGGPIAMFDAKDIKIGVRLANRHHDEAGTAMAVIYV